MSEGPRDPLHGWGPLLADLEGRLQRARSLGGPERIARQRARGRLDARQRVSALLDPDSFQELGTLVGGAPIAGPASPADGFVAGLGQIDGRPVLVGAEDFSVSGGSIGLAGQDKRTRLTQLALQERVPLVLLLEGAGHRISNTLQDQRRTPHDLQGLVDLSGRVPTACAVLGASAGHGALAVPLMDFSVMTEGAALFTAGPALVEAAIGERVGLAELGGPQVQVEQSGLVHNPVPDDAAALALVRRYLGYLPGNAWSAPPQRQGPDAAARRLEAVLELVSPDPRRPYPMRELLALLVDAGSLLELQPSWGASIVTALGFLGGRAAAFVANDPSVRGGAIDVQAAGKAARFLERVGGFHLPVVFLADNPGVLAGSRAEQSGALAAAARLFAAQRRLRSPKISVTLRKAFGFGSSVMAMNPFDDQTLCLAFPGVSLGAMPARGGGAAAGAGAATQQALDEHELDGPWRTAHSMGFDEIIDPRDLRDVLLRGLALLAGRDTRRLEPLARVGALP